VFDFEEKRRFAGAGAYLALSLLSLALIDLGVIQEEPE